MVIELTLHVHHVLHNVRCSTFINITQNVGVVDLYRPTQITEGRIPGQIRSGDGRLITPPTGKVTRHVETRITCVLRVEYTSTCTNSPPARGAVSNTQARRPVIVVVANQSVTQAAVPSNLDGRVET